MRLESEHITAQKRFDVLAIQADNQVLYVDSTPAVCVPPGARLLLQDLPERLQQALNVGSVEEVMFVEQSADAFRYRDAVRFANGREILLQRLASGQRVLVLSLDTSESEKTEPDTLRQIDAPLHELGRLL